MMAGQNRKAIFIVNKNRQEAIDAESNITSLLTGFESVADADAALVDVAPEACEATRAPPRAP